MPSNDMTFYGLPNARLAHERSCRAVGDRSGVGPRRRHRGGFAAGPSTADRRRARRLGLAGGQRRPQRNQRRSAHGWILLHPAAEGDGTQDLYADRFRRLQSVSRLVCHLSLPCWLQALRRYRLDSRSVLPAAHLAPQPRRRDHPPRLDDDLSGVARAVCTTQATRSLDASGVAVRIGHWGHCLLDALSPDPPAVTPCEFVRKLREEVAGHPAVTHPFLRRFAAGGAYAVAALGLRIATLPSGLFLTGAEP